MSIERQLKLEEESRTLGIKRYRDQRMPWRDEARGATQESELPPGQVQLKRVIAPLAEKLDEWVNTHKTKARFNGSIAKMLEPMDMETIAFLTAKRVINSIPMKEPMQRVALDIAKWIIDQRNFELFKESAPGYCHVISQSLKTSTSNRHKSAVIRNSMQKAGIKELDMTVGERVKMGVTLLDIFIAVTGMVQITKTKTHGRKTVNLVTGTDVMLDWLEDGHARCEVLSPMHMPMVDRPQQWTTPYDGGYYNKKLLPLQLVKTRNQNYLEELNNWDMPTVYKAVNALQDTPWRINKEVLNAVRYIWSVGSTLGGLPLRNDQPMPTKPLDIATNEEARKEWKRKAAPVHAQNHRLRGKRVAAAQKIWIAEKFCDEEAIYFPHVLDWRGRIYPVPNLVNPQSDDLGKSFLEFAEGKPLGEGGGYWLAVHIANLFGVDKVSLDERVEWVQERSTELCMSAIEPIEYQFWAGADKPFQALAACIEWNGFMQQGDDFVSHLPIAQDGSNNGVQHFAMMMRDTTSGAAVNLIPSDKPQDIYQQVADVVTKRVEKDAASGDEMAALWVGKISRSIAKRPVMTLPYGATKFGMRDQLKEELRKQAEKGNPLIDADNVKDACAYLAPVIYECIGQVAVAARQAMDWLQESARFVAADNLPVRWTTPAGFPVMQAYRKRGFKKIDTIVGSARLQLKVGFETDKLDKKKQAMGIAPNVVHSLDASHLMSTVCRCQEQGLTSFAMIHDSYAVHAADIELMNHYIRASFVKQYEGDVLRDFRDQLIAQLPEELAEKLSELPDLGDLDIAQVLDSQYFFA